MKPRRLVQALDCRLSRRHYRGQAIVDWGADDKNAGTNPLMLQSAHALREMYEGNGRHAESLDVLAYRSVAVSPPTGSGMQNLLRAAQTRNQALGLTGILLYDRGTYFQWLEGPPEGLNRVWDSIERDPRHRNISVLRNEPIGDRLFDGWDLRLAHGSQVRIDAAIAAMEHSSERMIQVLRKPQSLVNLSLTAVVAEHILPRLADAHIFGPRAARSRLSSTASIWHAALGAGESLARHLVASESVDSMSYIDSLLDQGAGFNALYQEVFEPTQLELGKLWDLQRCDDLQLSIGLARLQVQLRRVNAATRSLDICRPGRSVLLASQPMESHSMGLAMSSEAFERSGWEVTCEYSGDNQSIGELVSEKWFDVLKIFQSRVLRRNSRLDAMRTTIDMARAKSLNPSLIVMVDGRTFLERPTMFRAVHATVMSNNTLDSVTLATRLMQASRAPYVPERMTPLQAENRAH